MGREIEVVERVKDVVRRKFVEEYFVWSVFSIISCELKYFKVVRF